MARIVCDEGETRAVWGDGKEELFSLSLKDGKLNIYCAKPAFQVDYKEFSKLVYKLASLSEEYSR